MLGKGTVSYLGTLPEPKPLADILTKATSNAAIASAPALPPDIELCTRSTTNKTVSILINHGLKPTDVSLPQPMRNLLDTTSASALKTITLPPQGVAVLIPEQQP